MTFDDLDNYIGEDILMDNEDPAAIAAEVSKLLNGLKPEDILMVHRLARDYASAMTFEFEHKDGFMLETVRMQGAVLEAMIAWLRSHGVNCSSLLPAVRMKMSVGL